MITQFPANERLTDKNGRLILFIKRDADDGSGDRKGGWILI